MTASPRCNARTLPRNVQPAPPTGARGVSRLHRALHAGHRQRHDHCGPFRSMSRADVRAWLDEQLAIHRRRLRAAHRRRGRQLRGFVSDQDAEHFNQLTPAQAEALALLAEEAGEVVQVVCKALRHGLHSFNPNDEAQTTNRTLIMREVGDLIAAVDILARLRVVNLDEVQAARRMKAVRVARYLHHVEPPAPEAEEAYVNRSAWMVRP